MSDNEEKNAGRVNTWKTTISIRKGKEKRSQILWSAKGEMCLGKNATSDNLDGDSPNANGEKPGKNTYAGGRVRMMNGLKPRLESQQPATPIHKASHPSPGITSPLSRSKSESVNL
ncbi:hypothetical protein Fot_38127 [Forsythia ovata]|uniref:Uncharacterized protein n=1 Tax=Forsythia ovata TaxID=205694 RepID=A0ABD1S101_9LAMI